MAKKSNPLGLTKPAQANEPAAPRSFSTEQALCQAISSLAVVELKYKDDRLWRTFEAHCVHYSSADQQQVNVYGEMTADPNEARPKLGSRNFEVGRIAALRITGAKFQRPREFDRFAPLYKAGIICCL
jgi:hypothetical protein